MEKAQLLETLNGLVARYEQHRQFIDKARAQAASGKFNNAVVEKVIRDHELKAAEVAGLVNPLLPELSELSGGLEGERAVIQREKTGIDDHVQEAELRAAIGELSEEGLEEAVGKLRETLADQNARIDSIDADLSEIDAAVRRWSDLAGPNGHLGAERPAARPTEPAPAPAFEAAPTPDVSGFSLPSGIEDAVSEDAAEEDDEIGPFVQRTEIREDVSVVFASGMDSSRVEEDIAIETGEINEPGSDGPAADVQFGFEEDILGGDPGSGSEVEIDLGGAGGAAPAVEEPAGDKGSEAPRRALLLYQEGTAEEQIYPFTGDTLTIGRGRENDIQIKNDSKVSRYHCKLYRRGNNFYIEDAKSSNGTLVNGELITDRRLFGGEEVIIGETFFRFRIMD